jgi:hypothetical protein
VASVARVAPTRAAPTSARERRTARIIGWFQ